MTVALDPRRSAQFPRFSFFPRQLTSSNHTGLDKGGSMPDTGQYVGERAELI
jgi:hypothetical protein